MRSTGQRLGLLLQQFFTKRLMGQKNVSPNTICSYRDTFRLLLKFASKQLHREADRIAFDELDAPLITDFLNNIEKCRNVSSRTRNLRLTAIRSFFRFCSYEEPARSQQIQRILSIPSKRYARKLIHFLTRPEVDALLRAPNRHTWAGRRDYALIALTIQTGLRLSEVTALTRGSLFLGRSAYLQAEGKGRKERAVPICRSVVAILKAWINEMKLNDSDILFPSIRGGRLSADAVSAQLKAHLSSASTTCPPLLKKKITFHCLRHTAAMSLLHAGVELAEIALWLGHESVTTTQIYLDADMELREKILSKTTSVDGKPTRYHPQGQLLAFLNGL
jgi:site-specific recombinase XerD